MNTERDPLEPPSSNGDGRDELLESVPGLARIAATAWLHGAEWALGAGVKASVQLLEAATSPQKAAELVRESRGVARRLAREVLDATAAEQYVPGVKTAADVARKVADAVPLAPEDGVDGAEPSGEPGQAQANGVPQNLREQGERLLARSRDVNYEFDAHPAYSRILSELTPDEGRVLRLLLLDGPQPSVDVRTGGPLGMVKSTLVAPGLSMIGARAGARYVDRIPSYLNNLFRLGLIWFSRETLPDPMRYQVLEAQPDVLEAIHSVRHAKVVRRSIHLTPFGEDFCRVCLTPEAAALQELPQHSVPREQTISPAAGES